MTGASSRTASYAPPSSFGSFVTVITHPFVATRRTSKGRDAVVPSDGTPPELSQR
jgi:hypothetical protein